MRKNITLCLLLCLGALVGAGCVRVPAPPAFTEAQDDPAATMTPLQAQRARAYEAYHARCVQGEESVCQALAQKVVEALPQEQQVPTLDWMCRRENHAACLLQIQLQLKAYGQASLSQIPVGAMLSSVAPAHKLCVKYQERRSCAMVMYTRAKMENIDPLYLDAVHVMCELDGEPEMCLHEAWILENGIGTVPRDDARAAQLYEESCAGGNMQSCHNLGVMYAYPEGISPDQPQDMDRAIQLYTQACEGDYTQACSDLGGRYVNGWDVPKDVPKGMAMLSKGCEKDNSHACKLLAIQLLVEQSYSKEGRLAMVKSCELGNCQACARIVADKPTGASARQSERMDHWKQRAEQLCSQDCYKSNSAWACRSLAWAYGSKHYPDKSEEEVYRHHKMACEYDVRFCEDMPEEMRKRYQQEQATAQ